MAIDLTKPASQRQFAAMVNASAPAISKLYQRGLLNKDLPAGENLIAYCKHLREQAAGRKGDGTLDLVQERARLAQAQADKIELEAQEKRGELVPVKKITEYLSAHNLTWRSKLLAITSRFRSRFADLTARHIEGLDTLIREILTELTNARFSTGLARDSKRDVAGLRAPAKAKDKRVGRSVPTAKLRGKR